MHNHVLLATEEFESKLLKLIDLALFDDSPRFVVSDTACTLSLEHWSALRYVLGAGALPSAVVVHRAQFETLLRSIWIFYAASDPQISKLSSEITIESEQSAKNMPQVYDMIAALEKKGPPQAYEALNRFKDNSWKALNSYAHAGIHPIRRHAEGYPIQLIEVIARNANSLAAMSAMQAAILSGQQPIQREIINLTAQYPECMPPPL